MDVIQEVEYVKEEAKLPYLLECLQVRGLGGWWELPVMMVARVLGEFVRGVGCGAVRHVPVLVLSLVVPYS